MYSNQLTLNLTNYCGVAAPNSFLPNPVVAICFALLSNICT